ncbi:MAG TPA: heme-binding protein [Pseudonocardia sp.]|jgi:uncharacterized protein GlcG (DUF336 family)
MSNTVSIQNISTSAAHRLIAAAETRAAEIGVPSVIAICDTAGVLKAYSRMDGAALMCVQVAQDKAFTAVGFGMPSHEWHNFIKDDAPLLTGAPAGVDRLITFGGGYPITIDDTVVGGIGVSGGHWSQDMDVAEAALGAIKGE